MRGPASVRWALAALLCLMSPASLGAAPTVPAVDIVPQPRMIERLGGGVRFNPVESAIRFALRDTAAVMPAVDELCATAGALFGAPPAVGRAAKFTVWVGIPGTDAAFDKACRAGRVAPARRLGEEGYALRIDRRSVLIAARSPRGAFYGLQSLNQLLRASHSRRGVLPRVRIIDWPALRVRAVMDDISRGPVPNPDYMRQQIRRLAELKVNALTYYTEHVVATRSHPEFAPPGGAITIDEWKAFAAFARRYHIDLIGNFQSFGHFDRILATPRYARLGEGKSLLSPAFGESYRLLHDIYREMVPAFTAPWFHVNCDETFDLGRGASGRLVDSLGKGRVYLAHLMKLREMLSPLGVRMMVWGDMLLENPGVIDLLPRDVVIATWTYDSLADFRSFISPFQSRGFDVLVAPGILNSYSVMPNFRVAFRNISRFVADGIRQGVLGAMTTVWDDGGTAQFARDWYGVAFAADRMWSGDTVDAAFDRRFDPALYGDAEHLLTRAIDTLLQLAELPPTDAMGDRNLWLPAIPRPGASLPLNAEGWPRAQQISAVADSLLSVGRGAAWPDDRDAVRFAAELYGAAARFYLGVLDAAESYRRAKQLETASRPRARACLDSALSTVESLRSEYTRLRQRLETLWLRENRRYALDSAEHPCDLRLQDLADLAGRLRGAITTLDAGNPLPRPEDVRLGLVASNAWYFRDWLVSGPIESGNLDEDLLAAMGGETAPAPPAVAQEFSRRGTIYRWTRLSAQTLAAVDLPPAPAGSCLYASALLESPASATVRALLGGVGAVKVFVNGAPVFERKQERPARLDADTLTLPLLRGKNHLLLKIGRPSEEEWSFSFRLPDTAVRNRKNRYRIEERP